MAKKGKTAISWLNVLQRQMTLHPDLTPLDFAVIVYHDRAQKGGKDDDGFYPQRTYSPWGWKDRVGRWYPLPDEVRPCCWGLAPPMRSYLWTYQRHCRSIKHVAMLFNVDERDLAKRVVTRKPTNRCDQCKKFIAKELDTCGKCLVQERLDKAKSSC